jgi:capsular polysaccharide biosynthesis protein
LAGQCSSLISLHGAGLSNMLFMKQGSIVLELRMKGDQQNLCYYSLASALSINYYYLFCTRNADNINVQDANISVDLLELEKILQQF